MFHEDLQLLLLYFKSIPVPLSVVKLYRNLTPCFIRTYPHNVRVPVGVVLVGPKGQMDPMYIYSEPVAPKIFLSSIYDPDPLSHLTLRTTNTRKLRREESKE